MCLSVGLLVCFLSATRHLSTLRRCLRVAERAEAVVASGPARAGKHMHSESTRAHAVQLLNEKIAALMPFKNKTVRARACCRRRNCRDFQKKGKRKPTCHFPSSVYSLPSLGVFTFRIVLNRILHKSSLLAPMESFVTLHILISHFKQNYWQEETSYLIFGRSRPWSALTFRIVLNRILHKSSLLAPMESRRTRRPTFTA